MEHPILFSAPMVLAILEGRKTQTRRIARLTTGNCDDIVDGYPGFADEFGDWHELSCPYGSPDDILWVRETWCPSFATDDGSTNGYCYRATHNGPDPLHWRPSIFMPRAACRIRLRVVSVRVERLHDITEEDAIAEGIERLFTAEECRRTVGLTKPEDYGWKNYLWHGNHGRYGMGDSKSDAWPYQFSAYPSPRDSFSSAWEMINAKRAPWASNPWVWRVEFEEAKT